ncbi:hypothetical protein [Aeoliella mucimassa]|uniref:Uncharacterized protein n=1 Tax=Aeoliella mucimassa TaxID=2527972 RepID=A0A518AN68_9BACT|nr:hypothetical protein [Aeoliella mucimassa]QDU56168.1 hypothetical protein Pan181_23730 [Aeoliella mucimassa]
MIPLLTRRMQKFASQDCQLVDRDQFCRLLLGFTHMERLDDPVNDMRGLRDLETGKVYLIDRAKLAGISIHWR